MKSNLVKRIEINKIRRIFRENENWNEKIKRGNLVLRNWR